MADAVPIDVVIPALNEEKHIGACIEALMCQDYPSDCISIYVVNSGTDRTAEIAALHGAIVLERPGYSAAQGRNAGLEAGSSPLVAFLDAHCVPGESWASDMAQRFSNRPQVGGCQGTFEYICTDPAVRVLNRASIFASDECLFEGTVSGARTTFPWIVTGNSMYRREALIAAGGFDDKVRFLEDTDLAWRVFLRGYQLVFCEDARVAHLNEDNLLTHLKKYVRFGMGARVLEKKYALSGRTEGLKPHAAKLRRTQWNWLLNALYRFGYWFQSSKTSDDSISLYEYTPMADVRRPAFRWTDTRQLRISTSVVYWTRDEDTRVAVRLGRKNRYVFDGSAALIWETLTLSESRGSAAERMAYKYDVPVAIAQVDADEFVDNLLAEGLLEALPVRV